MFNSQTSNLLTECRKYGLGFLGATQVLQQIPDDVKAAIYGATAIKIAGPVSHSDAMQLGREMYCSGEFIRSMRAVEGSHTDFAVCVAGMDTALRLTVPFGTLEQMPQINVTGHATLRQANEQRVRAAPVSPPEPLPEPVETPKKW